MDEKAKDIEAVLFAEGEPMSKKRLAAAVGVDAAGLEQALAALSAHLSGRGLVLVKSSTEVALAVAPGNERAVAEVQQGGGRDIGEAGLEVLSIILYRGASTRADIDYIRGVNSSFTIRVLLSRGLIERIKNPDDSREFLYRPTVELLAHLGIQEASMAPEYQAIRTELAAFESSKPSPGSELS